MMLQAPRNDRSNGTRRPTRFVGLATALFCVVVSAGLVSCRGPAGAAGSEGAEGAAGVSGPTGPQGQKGTQGDQGPQGDTGPSGDTGPAGRNAYLTGPGLTFTIMSAAIDAQGRTTVRFQITDAAGLALDRRGLYTEGAVAAQFVLSWLDATSAGQPLQYTSYITTAGGQAAADSGGTFKEVDPSAGIYDYTFGVPATPASGAKTHTVGVWASRDFQNRHYVANATFDFLPAGGAVTVRRGVVETTACNACHAPLAAHGGERRDVALCVLCHSEQTSDANGTSLAFSRMVHALHRGSSLANQPYQLVGDGGRVSDYSTVVFPQALQRCVACHTGRLQPDVWKTSAPTRAMCGSCHDGISFAGAPQCPQPLPSPTPPGCHAGGAMADDTRCAICHPATGSIAGIADVHLTPETDPASSKLTLSWVTATHTEPGQTPELVFTVQKDGAPLDLLASPLARLAVTVAGPTTDYATYWQSTIQGPGATGTLTVEGGVGTYRYQFAAPMPASAAGTYAFGLEGYLQPGGPTGPQIAALNPVLFAAVTDAAPVPRRKVVDVSQCDGCHYQLKAHGGARSEVQYCAFCHNANKANDSRVARFEVPATTAASVDFKVLIHKIHMGDALTQQPYVIGGFPGPTPANPAGTPLDFGKVRYPGDRMVCAACHAGKTYTLPVGAAVQPSLSEVLACNDAPPNPAAYCTNRVVAQQIFTPPTTAACTSCHDAAYVVAHAQTNTTSNGAEACATCHGPGTNSDVERVHAPAP